MTFGFAIGAGFVALAGLIAVTLIPTKMREVQVEVDDVAATGLGDSGRAGPMPEPVPAPAPA
jgi:hypothetical protein